MVNPVIVRAARPTDAAALSVVAARCFPLACPPGTAAQDIERHVRQHLAPGIVRAWIADGAAVVLAAFVDGADAPVGYALVNTQVEPPARDGDRGVPGSGPTPAELSKFYVVPECHGSGAASALMDGVVTTARHRGASTLWLGVNQYNERAQRFYRRHGFAVTGDRRYTIGSGLHDDFVMSQPLHGPASTGDRARSGEGE